MERITLKKEIQDLYNKICSMYSVTEAREEIKKFCEKYNVTNKSVISRLYNYSSSNKLESWQKTICENRAKELSAMISKDPSNIKRICKEYIKKHYPEMKEDSEDYKHMLWVVYNGWFRSTSRKSVCFFIHGKNGCTMINRKNNKKVNNNFKTSWFTTLKNFVKKLF